MTDEQVAATEATELEEQKCYPATPLTLLLMASPKGKVEVKASHLLHEADQPDAK